MSPTKQARARGDSGKEPKLHRWQNGEKTLGEVFLCERIRLVWDGIYHRFVTHTWKHLVLWISFDILGSMGCLWISYMRAPPPCWGQRPLDGYKMKHALFWILYNICILIQAFLSIHIVTLYLFIIKSLIVVDYNCTKFIIMRDWADLKLLNWNRLLDCLCCCTLYGIIIFGSSSLLMIFYLAQYFAPSSVTHLKSCFLKAVI